MKRLYSRLRSHKEPPSIVIHLGPHKTGSTAIQKFFSGNAEEIENRFRIKLLNSKKTHFASLAVGKGHFSRAGELLGEVVEETRDVDLGFLLSHEDFSGEMLGRNGCKEVYRNLEERVLFLDRLFSFHPPQFLFFRRDENDWLRSCYMQNLRHRPDFHSFDQFLAQVEKDFSWDRVIDGCVDALGSRFKIVDYAGDMLAGSREILTSFGVSRRHFSHLKPPTIANKSHSAFQKFYEEVNRLPIADRRKWELKVLAHSNRALKDFASDQ